MAADDVNLAFTDESGAAVEDGASGFVEGEEHAAFPKEGRFGAVHIFCGVLVGAEDSSAEGDDAALFVADGEHEAALEPVVDIVGAAVADGDDPAGFQLFEFVFILLSPLLHCVGAGWGEPDEKVFYGGVVEVAILEVGARGFAVRVVHEDAVIELREGFVQFVEALFFAGFARGCFVIELDLNAGAARKQPDGGHKVHVFVEHDEFKNVAADAASETVKNLALWVDGKGRRFFFVKGAEGFERGAGAFEGNVGSHDVGDVVRVADLFERLLIQPSHGAPNQGGGALSSAGGSVVSPRSGSAGSVNGGRPSSGTRC